MGVCNGMNDKEFLFAYGTLKDPDVQKRVIGRIVDGVPDTLSGYRKSEVAVDGQTYPVIVPDQNASVDGVVLVLTSQELEKMDVYETKAYGRVKVHTQKGTSAWVYVKR